MYFDVERCAGFLSRKVMRFEAELHSVGLNLLLENCHENSNLNTYCKVLTLNIVNFNTTHEIIVLYILPISAACI